MIKCLTDRGLLYSTGIAVNRLVPASLFRARVFGVYRFRSTSPRPLPDSVTADACQTDADFDAVAAVTHFDDPDRSARTEAGSYSAFMLRRDDHVIGGVWAATEYFDEHDLGLRIVLPTGARWLFAAHLAKSHRGSGYYGGLLSRLLTSDPAATWYASINPTNRASMAAHRRAIDGEIGRVHVARLQRSVWVAGLGDLTIDRHTRPVSVTIGR